MRFIYDIFFCIFALFYVPIMAVKGKFHAGFSQKFARYPKDISQIKKPVWIHAVSVGEALVAARLCGAIKKAMPDVSVVVSTTTVTGNEMIKKAAGNADGVFYYPVDLRGIVKKALDVIDPAAYIIIETELWPNMLEEVSFRSIPLILVNGRISDRSYRRYRKIDFITRKMLKCFSLVCTQTQNDAEKIKVLGCDAGKIKVTGNIKFDVSFSRERDREVEKAAKVFPAGKNVIVAGSTHFPEETWIIDEFMKLLEPSRQIKLVIAPRHIERKDAIRIYVEKAGLKCCFFSSIACSDEREIEEADVMIVDTIGHLKDLYSLATVVFIGGSLVKKGGQNPIEAARWGKAVIFGENMDNFREVARDFVDTGAAIMVEGQSALGDAMSELLNNIEKRCSVEKRAREVIEKNSGAMERTVAAIKHLIMADKN